MLRALVVVFIAFMTGPTLADGRADWQGYDWRSAAFGECVKVETGCLAFRAKWDWKRNQWVEISYSLVGDGSDLRLVQHLVNNDRKDSDFVCLTVLFSDASGQNIAVVHNNLEIGPRSDRTQRDLIELAPGLIETIASVQFGSKQCRDGAHQDDIVYERVLAALP